MGFALPGADRVEPALIQALKCFRRIAVSNQRPYLGHVPSGRVLQRLHDALRRSMNLGRVRTR